MPHSAQTDVAVSSEANKAVVRRLFGEAFNQGELSVVDELWIPDGLESGKLSIAAMRSAFPDYRRTIEAQLHSPELRRRVTVGLNKGEAKNALSRAVCFHRRGMVQDRTFDDRRCQVVWHWRGWTCQEAQASQKAVSQ